MKILLIGLLFYLSGCSGSDADKLIDQVELMAQQSYQLNKSVAEKSQTAILSKPKHESMYLFEAQLEDGSYKYASVYLQTYDMKYNPSLNKEDKTVYKVYYTVGNQPMIIDENGNVSLSKIVEINEEKSMSVALGSSAQRDSTLQAAKQKAQSEIGG